MNARIKQLWLAALRSGEYRQTTRQLKREAGFCCLGVLCDLHSKDMGDTWFGSEYLGKSRYPPEIVLSWAELSQQGENLLAWNNDHGATFEEIADIIEREL